MLTAGPNAALFCGVQCHSDAGMADACEHVPQAPGIAANDECAVNGSAATVFVPEDGRRSVSSLEVAGAPGVAPFVFTPPAAGIHSADELNGRLLLALRPLVLALRI